MVRWILIHCMRPVLVLGVSLSRVVFVFLKIKTSFYSYVFTLAGHFLIYIPLIVIISEGAQKTLFDLNSLILNQLFPKLGIVSMRVGLSYDLLRLSPCSGDL